MPLKISLKPGEKLFVGGAVILNSGAHAELSVLNDIPILRERDIMGEDDATSPCRRIYFCVQLMYMDPVNLGQYQHSYRALVEELRVAAPSTQGMIDAVNSDLAVGRYYHALKNAKKLVEYEEELIRNARESTG